jgi:hypothetical protein
LFKAVIIIFRAGADIDGEGGEAIDRAGIGRKVASVELNDR